MKRRRRLARAHGVVLAWAAGLVAPGAHADAPPPGWEAPPPRDRTVLRPIDRCGDDADCLHRQTVLDAPTIATPWQTFEIDHAALPVARSLASPADDAALAGAPAVRAIDGAGRPFPWPDGARREVRVLPPGELGEVTWKSEWPDPFFAKPAYRSMGYGAIHQVGPGEDVKQALAGPVSFVSIGLSGTTVTYDRVVGVLAGSPSVKATSWEHAETAALPGGFGHAFRSEGEAPTITFLFPEVMLGATTSRVKLSGGFVPGSRFSTNQPFTRYIVPMVTEASATFVFGALDTQRRRWFDALVPKEKLPESTTYVIAVSRTTAEKAPRIVILARPEPG